MSKTLPLCAHPDCTNEADPRWRAYCETCRIAHKTCDGHSHAEPVTDPNHPHPWNPLIPKCRSCTEGTTSSRVHPCWRDEGLTAGGAALADTIIDDLVEIIARGIPAVVWETAVREANFRVGVLPKRAREYQAAYRAANGMAPLDEDPKSEAPPKRVKIGKVTTSVRPEIAFEPTEPSFTLSEVEQILLNMGVDVTCGGCMGIAMTGTGGDPHTCSREEGTIPIPKDAGHRDPATFVAVHKNRVERLEAVCEAFVAMTRGRGTRTAQELERTQVLRSLGVTLEDVDKLLWGFPCGGCGCAESLCCCDQGETP